MRVALHVRILAVVLGLALIYALVEVSSERIINPPPPPMLKAAPYLQISLGHHVMMRLIHVHPGHFFMGSPDTEDDRDPSEGPRHRVTFKHGFYIGQFPVLLGEWVEGIFVITCAMMSSSWAPVIGLLAK